MLNKIWISDLETKFVSTSSAKEIRIYFFCRFHQENYLKITICQIKINSQICLIMSIYESFHQKVKYGWQRNHILQDLTGLEI